MNFQKPAESVGVINLKSLQNGRYEVWRQIVSDAGAPDTKPKEPKLKAPQLLVGARQLSALKTLSQELLFRVRAVNIREFS